MQSLLLSNNKKDMLLCGGCILCIVIIIFILHFQQLLLEYSRQNFSGAYFFLHPFTYMAIGILLYHLLKCCYRLRIYIEFSVLNCIVILFFTYNIIPYFSNDNILSQNAEKICRGFAGTRKKVAPIFPTKKPGA